MIYMKKNCPILNLQGCKLIKPECPVCQADLKGELPQEIKDKIKVNYRRMYPSALNIGLDIASQTQFHDLRRE